jgi:peptide/nickel transport system ATP-binding protein
MDLRGARKRRIEFDNGVTPIKEAPVLRVRDLFVRFQMDEGTLVAVDGISFNIEPGETFGLIGESGSGKTTAALALVRLLPGNARVSGRVELSGRDLLSLPEKAVAQVRGSRIAMVFHDPLAALNPVLRVGAQIAEGLRAHRSLDRRSARASSLELLRRVGLDAACADRYPHQLSGGMRQRALIAMAIACGPSLLVADEPTSALDPVVQAEIAGLLRSLQREHGIALLIATHDLGFAARLCDRVAVLHGGRIVEQADAAELFARPRHPYTAGLLRSLPPPLGAAGDARLEPVAAEPLLGVEDLSVDRDGARVLDRISFAVQPGEMFGIVGESGSGKSTLARAVLRLLEPVRGSVRWRGRDLLALPESEMRAARREMQIVFQDPGSSLDPRMTVAAILAEPLAVHRLAKPPQYEENARKLLRTVELGPELLHRYPHELSGGQAQRVALARALATGPALLVLDEALSALDVSLQAQMANLLRDLQRSLSIACLFISHDLRLTASLCNRIGVLSHGALVEVAHPAALAADPRHPSTRALVTAARGTPS